ncbi:MAG TPA: VOC family protein [Flavisolibacter sp.]|nr:VOC family protein [Flavisolibacter sp.]
MKKIVPLCFSILFLSLSLSMNAQKPIFNHLAIHVADLQASTLFYKDVIGLDTIPEPFHDGKHTWFSLGLSSQLHIIAGGNAAQHDKDHHLCLRVPSVQDFIPRLTKAGIPFEDARGNKQAVTLRPDGVKQIYFQDPDGYWIEINDARQ